MGSPPAILVLFALCFASSLAIVCHQRKLYIDSVIERYYGILNLTAMTRCKSQKYCYLSIDNGWDVRGCGPIDSPICQEMKKTKRPGSTATGLYEKSYGVCQVCDRDGCNRIRRKRVKCYECKRDGCQKSGPEYYKTCDSKDGMCYTKWDHRPKSTYIRYVIEKGCIHNVSKYVAGVVDDFTSYCNADLCNDDYTAGAPRDLFADGRMAKFRPLIVQVAKWDERQIGIAGEPEVRKCYQCAGTIAECKRQKRTCTSPSDLCYQSKDENGLEVRSCRPIKSEACTGMTDENSVYHSATGGSLCVACNANMCNNLTPPVRAVRCYRCANQKECEIIDGKILEAYDKEVPVPRIVDSGMKCTARSSKCFYVTRRDGSGSSTSVVRRGCYDDAPPGYKPSGFGVCDTNFCNLRTLKVKYVRSRFSLRRPTVAVRGNVKIVYI